MKNVIFLIPSEKKPSGGIKIIYEFSRYINTLNDYTSSIVFLKKKKSINGSIL